MNLILLGAPGAGKGTIAKELCPELNVIHLSTGDMLRDVVASGNELGKEINDYMSKGELVPDQLIGKMIKEKLSAPESQNGVLLDGFPRNVEQANMLEDIMNELKLKIDKVYYLDIDLEIVIQRLTNRVSCSKCGKPFHLINMPPKVENVCDYCAGQLTKREDDNEETIKERYQVFIDKTKPLIDYYEAKNSLKKVDSGQGVDETVAQILANLR